MIEHHVPANDHHINSCGSFGQLPELGVVADGIRIEQDEVGNGSPSNFAAVRETEASRWLTTHLSDRLREFERSPFSREPTENPGESPKASRVWTRRSLVEWHGVAIGSDHSQRVG